MLALSGTLLNAATVLVGGLLGTVLGDRLPERMREQVVRGVGLFVLVMGVKFALDTGNLLYLLGSIVFGGILGSLAAIDRRLNSFGDALQRRFATPGRTSTVSEAFVTASIVFCVGPRVLDGFTAIALAATLGWGVLLTIVVILVYQGGLALGAAVLAGLLSDVQLREMNAVGGLLILGVGLKLLKIADVKVADFLPAILVAPLLVTLVIKFKEAFGI